jgi:N6-adenosine-specific RNA methylase IME4|tara:strand:- start:711 stop:1250 length:540 start_codon:yes stop_codon:yes gene_type:complete
MDIDKTYNIIYADPPWHFQNWNNAKAQTNPIHHYKTMTMKEIEDLPIGDIAKKDCALFMWCTDPLLHKQIPIVEKWGFTYKTVAFHWVKMNKKRIKNYFFKGPGLWTRANPEICILATRGHPKRISGNVDRLVVSERREHSRKPDRIRNDIVNLCGDLPRIELFARQKTDGWDAWGNEV